MRDTPVVRRRIEADLALALREVRTVDPELRALVLTGGFARGEGMVLQGRPQNDYDLVALRGLGPAREPYGRVRARLEQRLGLHVDLQPVWAGRLRWAPRSIFWYETALRGRVLWGDPRLLARIPARRPEDLDPGEGLRLLVNRAAGLLLARPVQDPHLHRIQAAKGLLAALDAHLLAAGHFAPSQRERWALLEDLERGGRAPAELAAHRAWVAWGFAFKTDPERAEPREPGEAWRAAAEAVLGAVPVALRSAGLADLEAYARSDTWLENLVYRARGARRVPGARWGARHPTGTVRLATLALLRDVLEGRPEGPDARRALARIARAEGDPLQALARLRDATLQ